MTENVNNFLKRQLNKNKVLDMNHVREQMEKAMKINEMFKLHPYAITHGADDRWRTYIPDERNKYKRKLVSRKTEEALYDYLLEYYADSLEPKVVDCLYEVLDNGIKTENIRYASYKKYRNNFLLVMGDNKPMGWLAQKSMCRVTIEDLDELYEYIESIAGLKPDAYRDINTVIRHIFKFARSRRHTTIDIETYINGRFRWKKAFTDNKNVVEDENAAFTNGELKMILTYCLENPDMLNLGIALMLLTGVRPGELSALKPEDILDDGKRLWIHRTETQGEMRPDGTFRLIVSDVAKTPAGIRKFVLSTPAQKLLQIILDVREEGEFLFMSKRGNRILSNNYGYRIKVICRKLGIPDSRSSKAFRKSLASNSLRVHMDTKQLIHMLGHTKWLTTEENYHVDNQTYDEALVSADKAVSMFDNIVNL